MPRPNCGTGLYRGLKMETRRVALRHFPDDFCPRISSGSQIAPDVFGIGRAKDFNPLSLQIHEVDMEFDCAVMGACTDAVLVVHVTRTKVSLSLTCCSGRRL